MSFRPKQKLAMVLLAAALVLAALLVARMSAAGAVERRAMPAHLLPGMTPKEFALLRERALYGAAEMGESHPTNGVIVSTTQHSFFAAQQGGPSFGTKDFPVYVVAYRGNFTASMASYPGSAPKGHSVYVVYAAKTLKMTDWGIGDGPPTLSKIGPSIPLDLGD